MAIKVLESIHEMVEEIEEEYQVLRDLSEHPNMPRFYGMYLKRNNAFDDQMWLVIEVRCLTVDCCCFCCHCCCFRFCCYWSYSSFSSFSSPPPPPPQPFAVDVVLVLVLVILLYLVLVILLLLDLLVLVVVLLRLLFFHFFRFPLSSYSCHKVSCSCPFPLQKIREKFALSICLYFSTSACLSLSPLLDKSAL